MLDGYMWPMCALSNHTESPSPPLSNEIRKKLGFACPHRAAKLVKLDLVMWQAPHTRPLNRKATLQVGVLARGQHRAQASAKGSLCGEAQL